MLLSIGLPAVGNVSRVIQRCIFVDLRLRCGGIVRARSDLFGAKYGIGFCITITHSPCLFLCKFEVAKRWGLRRKTRRSQAFHNFQNLIAVAAVIDIHPLRANVALGIDNNKPHLWNTRHPSHWLARLGKEIELTSDFQIRVVEDRQGSSADLPHLGCLGRRIPVNRVDFGIVMEFRDKLLQLTELLNAELSPQTHIEDQYDGLFSLGYIHSDELTSFICQGER